MTTPERSFGNDFSWQEYLYSIRVDGDRTQSRNTFALEKIAMQYRFDANNPVIANPRRKLSYRLMAAEAHWILSGQNHIFDKRYERFSDDGQFLYGAYGPKFVAQLPYVVKELKNDLGTRRAVISLWERSPDPQSKDLPCTLSMQFLVRGGVISAVVSMRSSDIWLGIPYDLFSFSCMLNTVRLHMRKAGLWFNLGTVFINPGSCHLYETDITKADQLIMMRFSPMEVIPNGIDKKLHETFIMANDPVDFRNALGAFANAQGVQNDNTK